MGRVWVFQSRGPVFDSRRTAVVSGRASDLKCSCATLVYKSVDPHWYLKKKPSNIQVSHWVSQGIETINKLEFFFSSIKWKLSQKEFILLFYNLWPLFIYYKITGLFILFADYVLFHTAKLESATNPALTHRYHRDACKSKMYMDVQV